MQKADAYNYLDRKGIAKHHAGYNYLADAIAFVNEKPSAKLSDVYTYVAAKCGTTATKVAGDIRYAVFAAEIQQRVKNFIWEAAYNLNKGV